MTPSQNIIYRIWLFTALIVAVGLLMLYSASHGNVRVSHDVFYDQLWCAGFGAVLLMIFSRTDYRRFYDGAYVMYVFGIILLILVMIKGRAALGATRWLSIGPINFQPSELTKVFLILTLARYYAHHRVNLSFDFFSRTKVLIRDLIIPLGFTGFLAILIFKQPDLGTAILTFGIFLTMLLMAGISGRMIFGFLCLCVAGVPLLWQMMQPYQKDRLLVFLNPNIDPLGAGYTIIQSKIAIGSGQIWGKGWMAGTQSQLNFLPERHTDFIFGVLGEEWGMVGGLFLIGCYFFLIKTALDLAGRVKDRFGMLLVVGVASILALQVIINIGMVMGAFPIVGITLPLVSYGRTSFLVFTVMIGILLSVAHSRQ